MIGTLLEPIGHVAEAENGAEGSATGAVARGTPPDAARAQSRSDAASAGDSPANDGSGPRRSRRRNEPARLPPLNREPLPAVPTPSTVPPATPPPPAGRPRLSATAIGQLISSPRTLCGRCMSCPKSSNRHWLCERFPPHPAESWAAGRANGGFLAFAMNRIEPRRRKTHFLLRVFVVAFHLGRVDYCRDDTGTACPTDRRSITFARRIPSPQRAKEQLLSR